MELAFLLVFLIVFAAMIISNKMGYRIVFGAFVILCLMFDEYGAGMERSYGRRSVIQTVKILAEISPEDQRQELIKATDEFAKNYRKERYGMSASSQLLHDIEEVVKTGSTTNEPVRDVAPE